MNRLLAMISIVVIALPTAADAGTITENTLSNASDNFFAGQSFFTGPGGPWTMITFNWFDENAAATAPGTLYLFTSPYGGNSTSISTSSPGFLAASVTSTNGKYIFDSSLTLASDTEYYAYTDTSATLSYSTDNPYGPGTAYRFVPSTELPPGYKVFTDVDMAFRVEGVSGVSATPEPTSLALFGIGAVGGCIAWRRRRQASATGEPSFEAKM